jgi:hypothetical protein
MGGAVTYDLTLEKPAQVGDPIRLLVVDMVSPPRTIVVEVGKAP